MLFQACDACWFVTASCRGVVSLETSYGVEGRRWVKNGLSRNRRSHHFVVTVNPIWKIPCGWDFTEKDLHFSVTPRLRLLILSWVLLVDYSLRSTTTNAATATTTTDSVAPTGDEEWKGLSVGATKQIRIEYKKSLEAIFWRSGTNGFAESSSTVN